MLVAVAAAAVVLEPESLGRVKGAAKATMKYPAVIAVHFAMVSAVVVAGPTPIACWSTLGLNLSFWAVPNCKY